MRFRSFFAIAADLALPSLGRAQQGEHGDMSHAAREHPVVGVVVLLAGINDHDPNAMSADAQFYSAGLESTRCVESLPRSH